MWDGTQWVSMTGGVGDGGGGGEPDDNYLRLDGANNNASPTNWLREVDADSRYLAIGANAASASKWSSARTLSLTGDATGSVLIDGSANVTLTVSVVNDAHTHDTRYYTEGESDSRFLPKANPAATGTYSLDGQVVLDFLTSNTLQLKRGSNVIVSSDGANWFQIGGVPFSTAQYDVVCDESAALRTIKYTGSSRRFKKDIKSVEGLGRKVLDLKPRSFRLKPETSDDNEHLGFIAEELYEVDPRFAKYDDKSVNNIDRDGVLAAIVANLQLVNDRLSRLESSSVSATADPV